MSIFRVHVAARQKPWGDYFFKVLEDLFAEVCRHRDSAFQHAYVYWWADRPVHQLANEPIVWILPNKQESMITRAYGVKIGAGYAGATIPGPKGTISEIYADHQANQSSQGQAKMAFHELMHNKLRMGDEMHGKTFGLGRQMLDLSTAISTNLTSDDIRLMVPVLPSPVPQWVPPWEERPRYFGYD